MFKIVDPQHGIDLEVLADLEYQNSTDAIEGTIEGTAGGERFMAKIYYPSSDPSIQLEILTGQDPESDLALQIQDAVDFHPEFEKLVSQLVSNESMKHPKTSQLVQALLTDAKQFKTTYGWAGGRNERTGGTHKRRKTKEEKADDQRDWDAKHPTKKSE